ncbi:hypothetical protein [Amycolatopsis magusensis]|uniref:hypothetical protein n=1 Tax=Amycolatopsis magusensis TaxID=882444 RepID=UPI003C2EDFB0
MTTYPTLGFDPAPGDRFAVAGVLEAMAGAHNQMAECSKRLLEAVQITDDSEWGGDAAEEFSDHGDDLPKALSTGMSAVQAVGEALNTWIGQLVANQNKAQDLETRARALLSAAGGKVDDEQEARLRAILDQAQRLQAKHEREANAAASAIRGGPGDAFEPENDGFGVQLLDGISVASGEVAKWSGTVAAVAAVVPGGQPLAAGAGTLAAGAAGVNTLAGLGQKAAGSANAPSWGTLALGVVPVRTATSAVRGLRRGGALDGAKKGFGENSFVKTANDVKAIRRHSQGTPTLRDALAHKASRDELARGRELAGDRAGDLKNGELRELAREQASREAVAAGLRSPFDAYESYEKLGGSGGKLPPEAALFREGLTFAADPSADRVERIITNGTKEIAK